LLVLKGQYSGPYTEVVLNYGGNISASFAVYFIVRLAFRKFRINRLFSALISLLIVQIFEVTNGFGVMANVYDPLDLLANAIGITLAVIVDIVASNLSHNQSNVSG
jgi:hypothetical protein